MDVIERLESNVRRYCRMFPVTFATAEGCHLFDDSGNRYLDFFSGAGALNYGHNNPHLRSKLIEYIQGAGVVHGLDMTTTAKIRLLERFESVILKPRGLDYKVQFTGPTGTDAVESALRLARKVTNRNKVLSFTNAFHGMTLGSRTVSDNALERLRTPSDAPSRGDSSSCSPAEGSAVTMPFDGHVGEGVDGIDCIDRWLTDKGGDVDAPAATIIETVQAEGGVHVASYEWLRRLEALCRKYGMLLIVDDVQVGCGRTGPFFSFEPAGIYPDLVCLSKSLSGYGLPLAFTLIRRELDQWWPGEHSGTFRGNNVAFVTAAAALDYWQDDGLCREVQRKGRVLGSALESLVRRFPNVLVSVRGQGLIQGLECASTSMADRIRTAAFERGLIVETAGPGNEVLKLLPPLVIENAELTDGLKIIEEAVAEATGNRGANEQGGQGS